MKAESVALRTLNQYRRIDIFTYLSLRLYLESSVGRTNNWVANVAKDLVKSSSRPVYLSSSHFKEVGQNGVVHRVLHVPCANEALVEALLLSECAEASKLVNDTKHVYSYFLAGQDDRFGMFHPYFKGLQRRNSDIAKSCKIAPNSIVRYFDIRKFYPSISTELACKSWTKLASAAKLDKNPCEAGLSIIERQRRACGLGERGILTGPMFSHLIGNTVLHSIDAEFGNRPDVRYFRYVDDIIFVGDEAVIQRTANELSAKLQDLGLTLHSEVGPKSLQVPAMEWLEGEHDFAEANNGWAALIGDLKLYLLAASPATIDSLIESFKSHEIRLPVRDYTSAIREVSFLKRVRELSGLNWYRRKFSRLTSETILQRALHLRESFEREYFELLEAWSTSSDFARKRLVPKLRFRAGRLAYLATNDTLEQIARLSSEIPEMAFHTAVSKCVATRNIDQAIGMGVNVIQAAAQPLRMTGTPVTLTRPVTDDVSLHGLSVLAANGVEVNSADEYIQTSELLKFSMGRVETNMFQSENEFLAEISALHGADIGAKHSRYLDSAFDVDEDVAYDAIEQLHESCSV